MCFESKAIGAIASIVNTLLDLKTNRDWTITQIRKVTTPLIHTFTDSIVILDHVNVTIEYIKLCHIARFLLSQYRRLSKNVPLGSEWLCRNDIKKRVMTFTTMKKLRNSKSTSFPTFSSFLYNNPKILWWFLKTLKIILDMVCMHESVHPKKSTKNLQVPETHDKLKLVIFLFYNLSKNLIFSLLNKVESIQSFL